MLSCAFWTALVSELVSKQRCVAEIPLSRIQATINAALTAAI
jgi:hypothetical protein